jgi:hypothetical protein
MGQTLARTLLELENTNYRGTGGVSENNRCMGFQPAFIDPEIGTVYLSRFSDGRLAPCHLFDGLPAELVLARDVRGRVARLKPSVVSGFVRREHFYTRDEAAALHARHDRLRAAEFERARRQRAAERY